jgi:sugar phosphate isomerase/epimerase
VHAIIDGRDRRLGAIIDTGHYLRMGVDPVETIHAFAGRLHGLHLKDVVAANVNAPDAVLGEGLLDVTAVACALRDVRIPAYASLSLEYEGEPDAPYDALSRAIGNFARGAGYCK